MHEKKGKETSSLLTSKSLPVGEKLKDIVTVASACFPQSIWLLAYDCHLWALVLKFQSKSMFCKSYWEFPEILVSGFKSPFQGQIA